MDISIEKILYDCKSTEGDEVQYSDEMVARMIDD